MLGVRRQCALLHTWITIFNIYRIDLSGIQPSESLVVSFGGVGIGVGIVVLGIRIGVGIVVIGIKLELESDDDSTLLCPPNINSGSKPQAA